MSTLQEQLNEFAKQKYLLKQKVFKIIDKIHVWIDRRKYSWYYKRVDQHFKQYPFRTSVRLLHDHYIWQMGLIDAKEQLLTIAFKTIDEKTKELQDIKFKLASDDRTTDLVNQLFGTDFGKTSDN